MGGSYENLSLRSEELNFEAEVLLTKASISSNPDKSRVHVVPTDRHFLVGEKDGDLRRIVFHLINFENVMRRAYEKPTTISEGVLLNEFELRHEEWNICLSSHEGTGNLTRLLASERGYGITHYGYIERADKGSFKFEDASNLLENLNYFFSFCRGFWVPLTLLKGLSESNEVVLERWGILYHDSWKPVSSWFDAFMGTEMEILFPLFMAKVGDPTWGQPLKNAIYWYLRGNTPETGVDGSLILTQSGLELLAWVYIIEHKGLLTVKGFKNLKASDQLRLLATSLDLPIEIPNTTEQLVAGAAAFNWEDSLQAITSVRNGIIHPQKTSNAAIGKAVHDAWALGQWYFEAAILQILGYKGKYSNRIAGPKWVGEVQDFPPDSW